MNSRTRGIDEAGSNRSQRMRDLIPGLTILALVVGVYLLINLGIKGHVSGYVNAYVIQPVLWTAVTLAAVLAYPRASWGKIRMTRSFVGLCLLLGALQVAVLLIAGLFMMGGLGKSPYSHGIGYLFLNTVFFVSALLGLEFSRAFLVNAVSKRGTTFAVVATALLYTMLMTALSRFTHITNPFQFFSGTILPLLAQNLLASLLALLGGPIASISFWGIMEAFEWYSPILPDPSWIVKAFAVTLASVIGLLVVQSLYSAEVDPPKPQSPEPGTKSKKRSLSTGWVVVAIICVLIIFFSFGGMGFRPLLVGSGSMKPALDVGDIAFVRSISADSVNKGDIIDFQDGTGSMTLHRVIEIQQDGKVPKFITKGDANDSPDLYPVAPEQLRGKVWFRIPKLGWISIWMKNLIS